MSNVNIRRAVENIRSGTSAYTPLVEVIVNAIQAIESIGNAKGLIEVTIHRSQQAELDGGTQEIEAFSVSDNGIGFTDENRESFDTLYTALKLAEGGKGFGRFTCLKYFDDVKVESVFISNNEYFRRSFKMGRDTDIIIDEHILQSEESHAGTTVTLSSIRKTFPEKNLETIARTVVEKLLPYFIDEEKTCPKIVLKESHGNKIIVLNEYLNNPKSALISEVKSSRGKFSLTSTSGEQAFNIRVFKIYSPKSHRSKISLVAHRREVTTSSLHSYIPEFYDEFYDTISIDGDSKSRNFVIAVYVFSQFLDDNVCVERGGFELQKEQDIVYGVSQRDIESKAAEYARSAVSEDVKERTQKKVDKVNSYVRETAPWYSDALKEIDLSKIPHNPTNEEIDTYLHKHKYAREVEVKGEVRKLLETGSPDDLKEKAAEIVSQISGSSKSELAHYVALRKSVLDIFDRSLSLDSDGKYSSEEVVHEIIFPTRKDVDNTLFHEHNLWIIDERLNFSEYLSSDLPLDGFKTDRPDILVFDKRIGFRGDNEASNPVTIFEFKKPQRDDFVNPSSKEDPVEQIIRYVIQIKDGKYKTPRGREILVDTNTPFYGYVICDLTPKVRSWVETVKDFKPMPDRMGYFKWHGALNLYTEVLGWDKVLKDANMRNRIFFHKLGIE
tara:strand:+ start:77 stop:2080 length:2004 start_codon:yes stop_codon:yes gene_type:complete